MKKLLSIFAVVVIFTACKHKSNSDLTTNKNMVLVDTTGLYKSNALTDVGNKYVITDKPAATESKNINNNKTAGSPKVNNNTAPNNSGSGTTTTTTTTTTAPAPAPAPRDKGWSDAAKGTAIGGGAGAVLGAVINKKDPVTGAVIGTVIGAGTGYAIGRSKDRKSGRVARARARRRATH